MATLGQNSARTVLSGLGSFWTRFFKDKDLLTHLFSATDQLMGQLYLELMEHLLANTVQEIPVFSKEFWKLLTFDSADSTVEGVEYKFPLSEDVRGITFIYNTIFNPTILLEEGIDYRIDGEFIFFTKNIFDDLEYPGIAKRRQANSTVASLWAPTARVDKEYVFEYYGRMLNIYEPSSENYKAFIRGIWFYYMNGPTVNRITSALNIIGGYSVASEDDELVLSIRTIGEVTFVKTTAATYEFPAGIELAISVGERMSAFQHMTNAYRVTDYIDNPDWFDHTLVPVEVIPNLDVQGRTTNRYDPVITDIGYPILIGDPRWRIGIGGLPNFMWLFFNQVLKYNIFHISYDAVASRFQRSTEDLVNIVLSGKPAYVLGIAEPFLELEDTVSVEDEEILMELEMELEDTVEELDEIFLKELEYTLTDTVLDVTEEIEYELEMTLERTIDTPLEEHIFEMEHSLTDIVDLDLAIDNLLFEYNQQIEEDSYGGSPVAFGSPATLIGAGIIGDDAARFAAGVPSLIGTNTVGELSAGIYTETALDIIII